MAFCPNESIEVISPWASMKTGQPIDYQRAFGHLAYIVGQLKHCSTEREQAQLIMDAALLVESVYGSDTKSP
jgi:hypothetical protein